MIQDPDYFSEGDKVEYYPIGAAMQTSVGTIERIISQKETIGTQIIKATEDVPFFLIKNEHTGKSTAYKMESIIGHKDK